MRALLALWPGSHGRRRRARNGEGVAGEMDPKESRRPKPFRNGVGGFLGHLRRADGASVRPETRPIIGRHRDRFHDQRACSGLVMTGRAQDALAGQWRWSSRALVAMAPVPDASLLNQFIWQVCSPAACSAQIVGYLRCATAPRRPARAVRMEIVRKDPARAVWSAVCVYLPRRAGRRIRSLSGRAHVGRVLAEQGITSSYAEAPIGSIGRPGRRRLAGGRLIGLLHRFMNEIRVGPQASLSEALVDEHAPPQAA